METSSVSKGCFVFKGRKKAKVLQAGDYFSDDTGRVHNIDRMRCRTYENCWKDVNTDIKELQAEVNSKIFEDLVNFIHQSHQCFTLGNHGDEGGCSLDKKKTIMHEIPTAALITGVNTPDHNDMFCQLLSLLQDNVTPYIALLSSKECSNMKTTMIRLLSQLMDSSNLDNDEDETADINMRRIPCTMPVLCGWYQEKTLKSRSQSRSQHISPNRKLSPNHYATYPPMVLVLEDFENFPPHVLQDLLIICNQYLASIPIVLIFGIATSVTAVHRLLPHTVSSLLCIEKFQAQPATEYLSLVIDKIILSSELPFKLSHKVFQFLLDIFLYHDFSVLSFIRGYQFAMMDHFYNKSVTLLCCPLTVAKTRIKNFTAKTLDQFRNLDSFRRFVEKQPPQEQKSLLLDDKHFKELLVKKVEEYWDYHDYFFPIMQCLHILTFQLPGHPLGKRVRELYSMCLHGDIVHSERFQEATNLLKLLARDELVSLLKKFIDYISEFEDDEGIFEEITFQLQTYIAQFDSLDDASEPIEINQSNEATNKLTKTGMYDLKKQLLESAKKKKVPTATLR